MSIDAPASTTPPSIISLSYSQSNHLYESIYHLRSYGKDFAPLNPTQKQQQKSSFIL